jgi:hypothetical protein
LSFIYHAHSTLAQLLKDLVMRYVLTDHCLPRYWQKYVAMLKGA